MKEKEFDNSNDAGYIENEFNLKQKRRQLFEQELLGKITSAGRIYRKIIAQDEEFIKRFSERINRFGFRADARANEVIRKQVLEIMEELAGSKLAGVEK